MESNIKSINEHREQYQDSTSIIINNPLQNNNNTTIQNSETTNDCQKISLIITGSSNIPLVVFIIFILLFVFFLFNFICEIIYLIPLYFWSSLGNILYAIFVWSPIAIKIEKSCSTIRYTFLFLLNFVILSIVNFTFPFNIKKLWCFVFFESLLIEFCNKNKKMKFFFFKIEGKKIIFLSTIYFAIFNFLELYSLVITIIYSFIYQNILIQKFSISNEKVKVIENSFIINWIQNKTKLFISIDEILNKESQEQPFVQNSAPDAENNSAIPANIYPVYYSGVEQNNQGLELNTIQPNNNINFNISSNPNSK